jgi:hypothetical protein
VVGWAHVNTLERWLTLKGIMLRGSIGKATRPEAIQRIKTLTVRSGAWIEGLEVQYQTVTGKQIVCSHGTGTGASTSTALEGERVLLMIERNGNG